MDVRFCPRCGEPRREGAAFCGKCAFAYRPLDAARRAPGQPVAPAPEPEAPVAPESPAVASRELPEPDADSPAPPLPMPASVVTAPPLPEPPDATAAKADGASRRPWPTIVAGMVVVGVVVVGLAAVALTRPGSAGPLPSPSAFAVTSPTARPATPRPATPSPTLAPVTPAPATVPPATPDPGIAALDTVANLVPGSLSADCEAVEPDGGEPWAFAVLATLRCTSGAYTVVYAAMPDMAETDSAYDAALDQLGLGADAGGCWNGRTGQVGYTYGRVACGTVPGSDEHAITWTYEPANVVAQATSTQPLRTLGSWWWFHALLQPPPDGAGLTADEQFLYDLVSSDVQDTCASYDPLSDSTGYKPVGSLGSIDCEDPGPHIKDVGLFRFTTAEAMDAWYRYRTGIAKVPVDSGGCFDGGRGETAWSYGRILCFVSSSTHTASIRWTDDRYLVYGALNATNKDLPALVAWWVDHLER